MQLEAENEKTGAYDDLIRFMGAFFAEYANHFAAVEPGAIGEDRNKLRKTSPAIANVMFHALVRIAKDLWLAYRREKRSWEKATEWREAIAKIAGKKADGTMVMSRNNPDWVGKIVIEKYGPSGVIGTTLRNTRTTRQAASNYLTEISKIKSFINPASMASKTKKKASSAA